MDRFHPGRVGRLLTSIIQLSSTSHLNSFAAEKNRLSFFVAAKL